MKNDLNVGGGKEKKKESSFDDQKKNENVLQMRLPALN